MPRSVSTALCEARWNVTIERNTYKVQGAKCLLLPLANEAVLPQMAQLQAKLQEGQLRR